MGCRWEFSLFFGGIPPSAPITEPYPSSHERQWRLIADDFDEDAFAAVAVEFAVEDLFPGAEVKFAVGDGDDDFAAHDLAFEVGVGVVFAGAVVVVLGGGGVGSEFFEPDFVVMVQSALVIVDKYRGSNMHRIAEAKSLAHSAFSNQVLDCARHVDKSPALWNLKPKMFGQ